ncbi:hypothetical protein ILUMI_21662 [Ignelater luminosus]|uniref:Mab-21-like HhH/H2TH-like domain-containing protein n=1 Tax=Ignelater luminosus TaxID=2038154 RepID=A0A8K0G181_IGNLU|nr:hypothetical protein ILUMI_21662 [Ignelater luminosus]
MGKKLSKHPRKSKTDSVKLHNGVQNVQQAEQYEIYDPEKYDLEAIEILKKEFKEDPEVFILNMLLMSFMFFDDYQEEIRTLVNTSSERGKKLNLKLIRDHQKQVLTPDSILESVNKRVKFQPSHGPNKDTLQPLVPQRMFILHDTIEIEDKNVRTDYSRIDKPSYPADIEESKEHKGFVKVNLIEKSCKIEGETRTPSTDSASSSASSKVSKRKSESSFRGDQANDNSESDDGYRMITAARTPKKIQISKKDIYSKINKLPSRCITAVKVKNEDDLSDSDSDEETDNYSGKKRKRSVHEIQLFRTHYYLNSIEFMAHFQNNVFPNTLGEVLGFAIEAINRTESISGAIYCNTIDEDQNIVQWEIIPAIAMPWPNEIAFEWTLRRRRTVWDKKEKTPIAYKWPTQKMIEEVNKLNCIVIPRGFIPKRPKKNKNPEMHIEWEVGFPKAERFLEFRMSHAQMRIFLYIIILHKYFIEPLTEKRGLIIDHIRIMMFWECETNYKAWPEHKLGTKLKLVLKNLFDHLSKAELPNYFIRGKNVLENIPRTNLVEAQNVIHRILETPSQYLLEALKHVKYAPGKFYSEPDLEKLQEILTKETVLPYGAHQTIMMQAKIKQKPEEHIKQDKGQKWNKLYREQRRIAHAENSKNLHEQKEDSINSNFSVKKRLNEDVARQILLLTFFIQHFLKIAKKSLKISSTKQTLFYLKQSFYLTKLLEDIEIEKENAKKFQMQIKEEEQNCLKKQVTEPKVPLTPKRNPSFYANEILQVKGKEINMMNLNKSYNSNAIENQPKPSTPEVNNNMKSRQNLSNANEMKKIVHVEVYEEKIKRDDVEKSIQARQHSPVKDAKRAVSFKSSYSDNANSKIASIDYDAESTSL